MADFGWGMPMGAEEAKDRQDRKEADWDEALAEETLQQLEALEAKLLAFDEDAIQLVADQLCPVKIVNALISWKGVRAQDFILNTFFSAKADAAEIMAIKKMENR